MRLFKSAFILSALLLLFGASELAAQTRKGMEKGLYVVTGRVINGNLIPNFGLNLGDIVEISDDGSTMTVLKSGKRFPVKPEEPNLQSADERLKQLKADAETSAAKAAEAKADIAKDEQAIKDTLEQLDKLLAGVPQRSMIVYDKAKGAYVVNNNSDMTFEQQKLFNELNGRLGKLRKEIKRLTKELPDAEAESLKAKKAADDFEALLATWKKTNAPAGDKNKKTAESQAQSGDLKARLQKLKSLYGDGLITKDQYDREVHEALNAKR